MANDWSHPPFSAELEGGFIWGRGAVDMKDMDAMILAVVRGWGFTGIRPRRDVVVLFLPDEEAGSGHGSHWLAANRPEIFRGVSEAVGEVGGFSVTVRDDLRLYQSKPPRRVSAGFDFEPRVARGMARCCTMTTL